PARCARTNPIAEARREALHPPLDPLGHLFGGAVRHVAVRPGGVPAGRRPRGIEQARLSEQDERPPREPAAPGAPLRGRDLLERAAEVAGAGAAAVLGAPRDR